GGDHGVGHADELLLDRFGRVRPCSRHVTFYLFLRFGALVDSRFTALVVRLAALVDRAAADLARPLRRAGAGLPASGLGSSGGVPSLRPAPGNAGASPSGPSGVTMIEWGRPSGPPSWPRISSVLVPPVRFMAIFCNWIRSFSLGSLPPFRRAQASTTSSM